ncbi:MAG: hypothetical protein C0467_26765 [Planctomycetaceae bacterium]|nr:hypothetical protein [Planctomycetaceae bacterium]
MTFIGKTLAIFNLLIGLGIVSWSASVYTQRPAWFDPIPEGGADKGSDPKVFAQLKKDAETLAKAANIASGTWGANLKTLETLEDRRDKRVAEFAQRLQWTKTGKDGKNAFFKPVWEKDATGKDTSVMQLYEEDAAGKYTQVLGEPIIGPDGQPLKGSETLLTNFSDDVKKVTELSQLVVKHREKYAELSLEILKDEDRLLRMIKIRDAVQGELFYLSSFEVNVYETRETVLRRQKQLVLRLMELGGVGLKPMPPAKVEKP